MTDQTVLEGLTGTIKTLVDGTVRLQVDFSPADRIAAMTLFSEPQVRVGICRLNEFKESESGEKKEESIWVQWVEPDYKNE